MDPSTLSLAHAEGCPQLPGYSFLQRQDKPGGDLYPCQVFTAGKSYTQLAAECAAEAACSAFSVFDWAEMGASGVRAGVGAGVGCARAGCRAACMQAGGRASWMQ